MPIRLCGHLNCPNGKWIFPASRVCLHEYFASIFFTMLEKYSLVIILPFSKQSITKISFASYKADGLGFSADWTAFVYFGVKKSASIHCIGWSDSGGKWWICVSFIVTFRYRKYLVCTAGKVSFEFWFEVRMSSTLLSQMFFLCNSVSKIKPNCYFHISTVSARSLQKSYPAFFR